MFGGRAVLQHGSSVRHPQEYLDFVLPLQHQIFVLFFSLLYFKWVGNVFNGQEVAVLRMAVLRTQLF